MFEVEPWPEARSGRLPSFRVIDATRDAWLQFVQSTRSPVTLMKLVWKGQVVPFEVIVEHMKDDDLTGSDWYRSRFGDFGDSTWAKPNNIPPFHFSDPASRREAQLIAVEALLAFGAHYDGDTRPDGYNRVEFEGRLYRKSDFGMS